MRFIMYILQAMLIIAWVLPTLGAIAHAIVGNVEQVASLLKLMGELYTFEFMVITCLAGIYATLEERK